MASSGKLIGMIPAAVLIALTLALLSSTPASAAETAAEPAEAIGTETAVASGPADDCRAVLLRMAEQDSKLTREMQMLRRDIAALSQKVEEPGLQQAIAGLGYILGLFGIAAFMASRRQRRRPEK
jgi:Skp family chaperone for outer membrane proteins